MMYYLARIRFIRSVVGGTWYWLRPKEQYGIYGHYWTKRKPLPNEIVMKIEDYS